MQVQWHITPFHELSSKVLYDILQLRSVVFVVEQNCVYLDADGKDEHALHLYGLLDTTIVAYARLLPQGISYDNYCSIGRVVSNPNFRKHGFGKQLLQVAIQACNVHFQHTPIKIGAQQYLQDFYESFGFVVASDMYLEDGIPHITMVLER
ncbi:MAG: GNAT family N-acetyltransferase [Chitinophagaceae bacterium]